MIRLQTKKTTTSSTGLNSTIFILTSDTITLNIRSIVTSYNSQLSLMGSENAVYLFTKRMKISNKKTG